MLPQTRTSARRLREELLAWFGENARAFPWREPRYRRDPYAVLVSEVLLQQTRAQVVAPRFEAWMRRFPTVADLARAREDDVLAAWRGLGYYGRARRLHEAARAVQREHAGRVPRDVAGLRDLPGVGPYTAAAVASLAHGSAEPAVDGNVARVAARLEGAPVDVADAGVRAAFVERLRPIVEGPGPGAVNEALIELGATVCRPRAPRCEACPVSRWCTARAEGRTQLVPRPARSSAIPTRQVLALWVEKNGHVLLRRRIEQGVLARQWGLPMAERGPDATWETLARDLLRPARVTLGASNVARVEHAFTHKRWSVRVRAAKIGGVPEGKDWRWASPGRATAAATSTLDRRVLDAVRGSTFYQEGSKRRTGTCQALSSR